MKAKYGIQDCDTYNFDETGFMMGQICGHMVVTGSERRGKSKKIQPGNREWATAICCISGDGYDVPPYLIVKGVHHLANWYTKGGLPATWRIKTTPSGWTNNETGLDWIHHFDNYTKSRIKGAYRMLVLDGHSSHQSLEFKGYSGGFRGAGIIPHNPETVIFKLDIKIRTPSPKEPTFPTTESWVS
ncbi:hypothetical protein OOU_Y34scaffold00116g6 [Pyricularia oryzae Y34]|uniref:DDE-1 domain-containing protein n=1 Tax=Pyricularia oryzae (strain Y34) TaxID=1143189 RepID=A0AA97PR71_PYRO3|nr:hypothetical protein OOU_Y34scaffold00116g6 [Pyricularia oryzae Y34]